MQQITELQKALCCALQQTDKIKNLILNVENNLEKKKDKITFDEYVENITNVHIIDYDLHYLEQYINNAIKIARGLKSDS